MRKLILTTILLFSLFNLNAQKGYSSASVSMNRSNGVFTPEQVIVEEYLNYHTHNITLPKGKQKIALSIDANQITRKTLIVQIGIATKNLIDYSNMPPVNINLVIDRSGSMSGGKLQKVKKALLSFIKGLRPEDYVSVTIYDNNAEVILSSQKVKEIPNLKNIIESITTGGSTNLCEGMVSGYKEAQKNFNAKGTNKVILLTDGLANEGITNPEDIIKESYKYNKEGIDISTIGVGSGLDFSLLQQLSRKGKGANHFVGDVEEDIIKVFEDELESLLSSIAKNVYIEITYPKEVKLNKIYGYSPQYDGNKMKIPLKNINLGLTQIILSEIKVHRKISKPIKVELNYFSISEQKKKKITIEKLLEKSNKLEAVDEVLKNYYIGEMASSLKEMAKKVEEGKTDAGLKILENTINKLDAKFPHLKDKDIIRIRDILMKVMKKLDGSSNEDEEIKGYLLIPVK